MTRIPAIVAVAVTVAGLVAPTSASAAFPGRDGELLASATDDAGDYWLVGARRPYTVVTVLTDPALGATGAIWSPRGAMIAFDAENQVWTMHADGSHLRELTTAATGYRTVTGFSPDGSHLLYMVSGSPSVWKMRVDGTGKHVLETPPAGTRDTGAVFAPNGRWIAVSRLVTSGTTVRGQIYRMRPDGSQQVDLSRSAGDDQSPDWAPDSSRIVFQRGFTARGFWQVYSMTASGAAQSDLSRAPNQNDTAPTFTPSGRQIVFNRFVSIWRMGLDGGGQAQLLHGAPGNAYAGPSLRPVRAPAATSPATG